MSNLSNKKVLVVNDHAPTYYKPFEFLGLECTRDHKMLETEPDEIALVVFTGGHDVSPQLYGKESHYFTSSDLDRDIEETKLYELAIDNNIPTVGICRGAQFLCVMAGGKLIQDVTNHNGDHEVFAKYPEGHTRLITVSSSHHQMQHPFGLPENHYEVLAWGKKPLSEHYAYDNGNTILSKDAGKLLATEPDVVWYPKINALGAQYHPEWMREDTDGFGYFQNLVTHYIVPLMEKRYDNDDIGEETTTSTS